MAGEEAAVPIADLPPWYEQPSVWGKCFNEACCCCLRPAVCCAGCYKGNPCDCLHFLQWSCTSTASYFDRTKFVTDKCCALACDFGRGYNYGCGYGDCVQCCRRDRLSEYHCAICLSGLVTYLTCFNFCGLIKPPIGYMCCSRITNRMISDKEWDEARAAHRDKALAWYNDKPTTTGLPLAATPLFISRK